MGIKTYTGIIRDLLPNQIFVFGSNTEGRHGKGAAWIARTKFGAVYRQARGLQGQSYAIVTKNLRIRKHPSVTRPAIKAEIAELYRFARKHPELEFWVAYTAGVPYLSGYTDLDMAQMFNSFPIPDNMVFEDDFYNLILSLDYE